MEKLWDIFDDGEADNPYSDKSDFDLNLKLVNNNGYMVSGRAFSHWGMKYMYEPIKKVIACLMMYDVFRCMVRVDI